MSWLWNWFRNLFKKDKPTETKPPVQKPQSNETNDTNSQRLYNKAMEYYGEKEISGSRHNQIIEDFFKDVVGQEMSDETAWCAAFVGAILKRCGFTNTKSLAARSYLKYGVSVKETEAVKGDIVIFWRESPSSWKGHVGFLDRIEGNTVYTLGGNQSNMVNIKGYSKSRLLDIKRVKDVVQVEDVVQSDNTQLEKIKYREDYDRLISTLKEDSERAGTIDWYMRRWDSYKERYQAVSEKTGVPAEMIFCIHSLEAGFDFKGVLHNGERIIGTGKKTRLVPKGKGPFETWEEAAIDALEYDGLTKVKHWDGATALYCLEKFNGFGYRNKGINSPYLWSFSNHYTKGKYVSDGKYDPNAVSKQCGGALLLNRLGFFKKE